MWSLDHVIIIANAMLNHSNTTTRTHYASPSFCRVGQKMVVGAGRAGRRVKVVLSYFSVLYHVAAQNLRRSVALQHKYDYGCGKMCRNWYESQWLTTTVVWLRPTSTRRIGCRSRRTCGWQERQGLSPRTAGLCSRWKLQEAQVSGGKWT